MHGSAPARREGLSGATFGNQSEATRHGPADQTVRRSKLPQRRIDGWDGRPAGGELAEPHSVSVRPRRIRWRRAVPFLFSLWGTRTTVRNRSIETLPAGRRTADPAGSLERLERLAESLVLDRQ